MQMPEWFTPELLQKFASNPTLLKGLSNKAGMDIIQSYMKDPEAAKKAFSDEPSIMEFLKEFGSVMSNHFENMAIKKENEQRK